MSNHKVAVIGAGISGLSVARLLQDKASVTLFEKAEKPGGLVKCDVQNGNLFHKVGGHVFNAKNKKVFDWFWGHFNQETEFLKARRNAKILIKNKLIGYPIENYLFEFEKSLVDNILKDLLILAKQGQKSPFEFENFEAFLKGSFGETLYNLYFEPYNRKIWNTDLSEVSLEWLEGKLPMPDIRNILLSNIVKEEESTMVHSSFYYPVKGGSQFIADRLATGLTIRTLTPVDKITYEDKGFELNGDERFDQIVYTGDIRKLKGILQLNDPELPSALEAVSGLRSNGTSNLLCETDPNDLSWLYIPEPFTRAHRIIYTGNFSPNNNREGSRKTCVVEFSGKCDTEVMKEEIKKLPGNLSPLSFNFEPNSYVVQEKGTREKIQKVKELLTPKGFHLTGRFAEWEYYNMDKAIEAAMDLVISREWQLALQ